MRRGRTAIAVLGQPFDSSLRGRSAGSPTRLRAPAGGPGVPSLFAFAGGAPGGGLSYRVAADSCSSSFFAVSIDSEQSLIDASSIACSAVSRSTSKTFSMPPAPSIAGTPR
jgi:hypothetical protein